MYARVVDILTLSRSRTDTIAVMTLRQLAKPRSFLMTWRAIAGQQWEQSPGRVPSRSPIRSAEHYGLGEASLACLLVLTVHVSRGFGQSHHGRVEIDAVSGRDLVAGDRLGGPGLDCTECAALDARDLHKTGDRVAGHAQVMLQSRFGGILNHQRFCVVRSSNQCRRH